MREENSGGNAPLSPSATLIPTSEVTESVEGEHVEGWGERQKMFSKYMRVRVA